MLRLDHLAVVAGRLEDGVAAVESLLGVTMAGGGKHPLMATHNRLLGLGDLYLEVIAIDPDAPAPGRPRWFDMDRFTGPPRLANWVAGCDDLAAEVALGPKGIGAPLALQRGDYRWQMAVPDNGRLPFDGAFPALIQWEGAAHPARALPETGLRLTRLEITHPDATALRASLAGRLGDPRVVILDGASLAIRAALDTPNGPVTLC
ncbi:VOC family protein [Tabrizicola sp.]|uniref:VOC family protein n=1 Tax=Tabrizicola sp. TaxID=2005166 RepID=UPI002635B678|nr:VOC family protein [Tabrizicola sp.]MDM7932141.1 VOC family protein [Tabrizicola sp.]